jgi:hypothetical protein
MPKQVGLGTHRSGLKADGVGPSAQPQQSGTEGAGADQLTHTRERKIPAVLASHGRHTGSAAIFLGILLDESVAGH